MIFVKAQIMGGCYSKGTRPSKIKRKGKRIKNIPPNSPLGKLLERWDSVEATERSDKIRMIHYCLEVWPKLGIQGGWPWCGTKDEWMCEQLNQYLRA